MEETGYIHSFITGSAYDGPGLRSVVWTTGCHFRCQYCHNPDTWHLKNGDQVTVGGLLEKLLPFQRFAKATGGGVTVSGGEPLVQAPFVTALLRELHGRGVHTALDTNGFFGDRVSDADLEAVDLVLLDIKSWEPATHRRVTGVEVEPVLRFARRLAALGRPAWLRFVLVPGLSDDADNIAGLAAFAAGLPNLARVEILPFHQMGRAKWQRLGLAYPLEATPAATAADVERAAAIFRAHGVAAA